MATAIWTKQEDRAFSAAQQLGRVAVVVTSHNYGCYLRECLASIIDQSYPAAEIIVVDDSSQDETQHVTESFADQAVKYLRVEHRNALQAREAGYRTTRSPFIVFVDADDVLPVNYLQAAMEQFTPDVGVVYSDLQRFGESSLRVRFPEEWSRDAFFQKNVVHASALVRRQALDMTDAWTRPVSQHVPEDYWLWQRIAQEGWKFRKHATPLLYRTHSGSKSDRESIPRSAVGYAASHGLFNQDLTLFIPLSGRHHCWDRQREFLEEQTFPHDQVRLILCDNSGSETFRLRLRNWIWSCNYQDIRHICIPNSERGLADRVRKDPRVGEQVNTNVSRIYNRMRSMIETDFVWILEDDIIPPDDVAEQLLSGFGQNVASVTAPYMSRHADHVLVWDSDPQQGINHHATTDRTGITDVRGNGFGCVILRTACIREHVFYGDDQQRWFDPRFYSLLGDNWIRRCNWSVWCEHLNEDEEVD